MRRILVVLCFAALATACSNAASSPAQRAHAVEAQVWSPYCPGRLLIDCTTTQARQLRTQIQDRVADGESTDAVLSWVRREFGDEAIARPASSGSGLVIWLVPAMLFVTGLVIVVRIARRARRAAADV